MEKEGEKSKYKELIYFMSDDEFEEKFPTEEAAIEYFLKVRYGGNIICTHCGSPIFYRYKDRLKAFHCHSCRNSFSPFKDTIFAKTHISIKKWYRAIAELLNNRMGNSSLGLARTLRVSIATGWRMEQQIRIAMSNIENFELFQSIVEVDETYVGGSPRKQNAFVEKDGTLIPRKYPKKNKRGRGTKKTPVVGVKERDTGRVYAKVMVPDENGRKLTGKQLLEVLENACKSGTIVITDDFRSYGILDKQDSQYQHESVNHSKGEYCNYKAKWIHTNSIENFWSIVKPGLGGIYRNRQTVKYLQRYINEYSFKQNTKYNKGAFDLLLRQCILYNPNVAKDTIIEAA